MPPSLLSRQLQRSSQSYLATPGRRSAAASGDSIGQTADAPDRRCGAHPLILSPGLGRNLSVPTHRPSTIHPRTALFEDAIAIVESEYASELSLDDIARR